VVEFGVHDVETPSGHDGTQFDQQRTEVDLAGHGMVWGTAHHHRHRYDAVE